MGWLKFNKVTTNELNDDPNVAVIEGVVIQTPPVYEFPSRRADVIQIQGRNGDIIIDKNSFDNVNRGYEIASVFKNNTTYMQNVRKLVDWLSSVRGYARLEDSYESDYFRMAMFRSGGQFPNYYDKATAMRVEFMCKPQRFLKTGETLTTIISDGLFHEFEVENTTEYIALPKIVIENGFITIEVKHGDTEISATDSTIITLLPNAPIGEITIDSELQDVHISTMFINNYISVSNGFPKLYPGKNWIKVVGNSSPNTIVKIQPRWWVL